MTTGRLLRVAMVGLAMIIAASMASAQAINSGAQTIALNASLAESLTLSLSANAVNFTLAAGSTANAGSTNITATTTWVLKPGRTAVGVYAYFASAAAALTDGAGDNIPSNANVAITGANKNSSRTDVMAFNINLTGGTLPQLPAATYTGTLNIQAQATP